MNLHVAYMDVETHNFRKNFASSQQNKLQAFAKKKKKTSGETELLLAASSSGSVDDQTARVLDRSWKAKDH